MKQRQLLFPFRDVVEASTKDRYNVYDAEDPRYYARGDMKGEGILEIAICTKVDGKYRNLRAEDQFEKILNHFGKRVRKLHFTFTKSSPEDRSPMNDEIDSINAATQNGDPALAVVNSTHFARWAKARGFTKATVDTNGGHPGNYDWITAYFERP